MPTKQELAEEATVAKLKQLAADNEVDLAGASNKAEIVDAITRSNKVTKADLEAALGGNDSDDNGGDPTDDAGSTASVPQGAGESPTLATQDPAILDPEAMARERAEGRTSDASFREEGTSVDDPAPDLGISVKPTDGGPERYPFPQAGDVEVATVEAGSGEGEYGPILHEGHWVKLGFEDPVPERFRGSLAVVLSSPWEGAAAGAENTEVKGYAFHPDRNNWMVRVRDETDAVLTFPGDADPTEIFAATGAMRGDVASHA